MVIKNLDRACQKGDIIAFTCPIEGSGEEFSTIVGTLEVWEGDTAWISPNAETSAKYPQLGKYCAVPMGNEKGSRFVPMPQDVEIIGQTDVDRYWAGIYMGSGANKVRGEWKTSESEIYQEAMGNMYKNVLGYTLLHTGAVSRSEVERIAKENDLTVEDVLSGIPIN